MGDPIYCYYLLLRIDRFSIFRRVVNRLRSKFCKCSYVSSTIKSLDNYAERYPVFSDSKYGKGVKLADHAMGVMIGNEAGEQCQCN
jgi:hypothetical protein